MGLLRASRKPRRPDPYLRLKMFLFAVGAAAGLLGIATDTGWLVGLAIVVLAAGVALQLLGRRRH